MQSLWFSRASWIEQDFPGDLVWARVISILVLIFVNAGQTLGRIISLFRFNSNA